MGANIFVRVSRMRNSAVWALRRLRPSLLLAVEAVLDDVQIEAGQLHHAEIVDGVGHHVELIVIVGLVHLSDQLVELGDGPAVQLQHILGATSSSALKPQRLPRQ
jgi:hypothetical protein